MAKRDAVPKTQDGYVKWHDTLKTGVFGHNSRRNGSKIWRCSRRTTPTFTPK